MKTYSSQNWEIDIPEDWDYELNENILAIYDPDGVGALQISAYVKPDGLIDKEELLNLTELKESDRKHLGEKECGHFHGYQLIYKEISKENETFWRKWWLVKDELLLFVTYNCTDKDKNVELKIINSIMNTLRKKRVETR